jgi:hypothetical protein
LLAPEPSDEEVGKNTGFFSKSPSSDIGLWDLLAADVTGAAATAAIAPDVIVDEGAILSC